MNWRQKATEIIADVLRFSIYGSLLVAGISLSVAICYVVSKAAYFTVQYLNSTLFSRPWGT